MKLFHAGRILAVSPFLLALTAGCRPTAAFERLAQSSEARYAVESIALLQSKDVKGVLARMDSQFQTHEGELAIVRMSEEIVPPGPELGRKLVGYTWNLVNGERRIVVDFEYQFPKTYMLAEAIVIGKAPNFRLWRLYVQRTPRSLEEQNAFVLHGHSIAGYLVLAATIAVPVFILVVLAICIRAPIGKWKWLWVIYVLLGFGKLNVNWTTGSVWVETWAFQVLGAGYRAAGLYGPWILSASFPAGAILFLVRRRRLV